MSDRKTAPIESAAPVVHRYDVARRAEWDAFVTSSGGTFFHLSGWKTLFEESFGFKTHFLFAQRGGCITGVLPMVEQNSILFGRGLIAAPFCVEGGPLGDPPSCDALDLAAQKLMDDTSAAYIEFRSRVASRTGWQPKKNLYATFKQPLARDDETNLKAIPRKQRAVIRKAVQSNLTTSIEHDPETFYPIYARSVQNLGTPVFPRRYFRRICEIFAGQCDLLVVRDGARPISAVLNFYFGGTALPYYGGGLTSARGCGANDLLYWEVMRHAAARGCSAFDFGRSKVGTGAFAFKKNWGFEPEWLAYEYRMRAGTLMPDTNAASPKYRLLVNTWKRLPHRVADTVGPFLIRHLN
jgi:FemAB-related protein (PEP-CTERM system-associated)